MRRFCYVRKIRKSLCLARLPESRQQLIQPPVQSEGLLFDIVRNVDLPQIDGHISGVWLAGHQAHHRSLDQLIAPANAQLQHHQFLSVVSFQKVLEPCLSSGIQNHSLTRAHVDVHLKQLVSICPEILKNAGVEADRLRDRFCSGKPSAIPSCPDLEHIFAPLFSAPVSVRISLLKLKVLEILIYLSNMKSEHKELTQYFSQQTESIKEIHQQLTEHLDQRFTIAELSKQYLINTSTLKAIFKAVYGQPIATYMKEYRVRQAMKLLRETNDSIADIASRVGYQTQGKFSSAFQSIVKMSPREYRKVQGMAPFDLFSKTL